MRIGHLIPTLGLGGAEELLFKLIRNRKSRVVCHTIFVLGSRSNVDVRFRALNVQIVYLDILGALKRGRILLLAERIIKLNRLIEANRISLLHSWLPVADLVSLLIFKKSLKRVWGLYAGRIDRSGYSKAVYWALRICARLARKIPVKVISRSYHAAEIFPKIGYPREKIVVVPIGFDTAVFSEPPNRFLREEHEKVRIGMVARFDPFKDFRMLFDGLRFAELAGCDLEVHLSGGYGIDTSNQALIGLISSSALEANVMLHGCVEDLREIYQRLDLFILASKGEGFPNVIGEAMSCGVECIATDVGDARRIIGETGSVVPLGDYRALGAAIDRWAKMPSEQKLHRSQAARKRIQNNFNVHEMVVTYERLYDLIAQEPV